MSLRISPLEHAPALAHLAAGVAPTTSLAELRHLLREAGESFDLRYRGGEPVRLLVAERAAFTDLVVHAVWERFHWTLRG